jgi:hypothetical protein
MSNIQLRCESPPRGLRALDWPGRGIRRCWQKNNLMEACLID